MVHFTISVNMHFCREGGDAVQTAFKAVSKGNWSNKNTVLTHLSRLDGIGKHLVINYPTSTRLGLSELCPERSS